MKITKRHKIIKKYLDENPIYSIAGIIAATKYKKETVLKTIRELDSLKVRHLKEIPFNEFYEGTKFKFQMKEHSVLEVLTKTKKTVCFTTTSEFLFKLFDDGRIYIAEA